jgi:CRISPR-associated protein Cpf1
MRNSVTNTEKDYMISPVANENGKFYNSENEREKGKNNDGDWISELPVDADANGAYNIARKGLWIIKQIKESNDQKPKLDITNKEWLFFVQNFNK